MGIRSTASIAQKAIAIKATTTVTGLLRAARTRRIYPVPSRHSLACLGDEGPDVACCRGHSQQSPPDSQPRQRVVYLGLGEEPLSLRHLIDNAQSGPIAGRRLIGSRARRADLHRHVGGHIPGAAQSRDRHIPPRLQIGRDLLIPRLLRADRRSLSRLLGATPRRVYRRKAHGKTQSVILSTWVETIQPAQVRSVDFGPGAARVCRALQIEARKIRSFQNPELRP